MELGGRIPKHDLLSGLRVAAVSPLVTAMRVVVNISIMRVVGRLLHFPSNIKDPARSLGLVGNLQYILDPLRVSQKYQGNGISVRPGFVNVFQLKAGGISHLLHYLPHFYHISLTKKKHCYLPLEHRSHGFTCW